MKSLLGSILLLTLACGGYFLLVTHTTSPWTVLLTILAAAQTLGWVLTKLN